MSSLSYPFDPDVRDYVASLLYELLPALYRVRDQAPRGTNDLRDFLSVLAAPLAEVRQNIEELHADLFIDTCNDAMIPLLADMIGATLIFPDALSNRRDVRGMVSWRRRKGTPGALEEMSAELLGHAVITHEGWKRLLLAQDLNMVRDERLVTDLRPATLAESSSGPLDAAFHAVDVRRISGSTGRYHPRHVTHWTHPTRLFPVREGTAFDRTRRDQDNAPLGEHLRYSVHPLGASYALRVRREHPQDPVATDRVPAMHFAASPGFYFDQEGRATGRFVVRLSGLPGAVAAPAKILRAASRHAAHASLVAGLVDVEVLDHTTERLTSPVDIEVLAVPWPGGSQGVPLVSQAKLRGGARTSAQGIKAITGSDAGTGAVVMICLRPVGPETVAYFPGATVELCGRATGARRSSHVGDMAVEGFLQGALIVEVPRTWVREERWFYVAADGSIYDAQTAQKQASDDPKGIDVELSSHEGGFELKVGHEALVVGPGPAWPPLARTATQERVTRVPSALGRGPVVLHGGRALHEDGGTLKEAPADVAMGLVFAARITQGVGTRYEPFLRLDWKGSDPLSATSWTALTIKPGGSIVAAADVASRFAEIAELRESHALAIELVVRFEAGKDGVELPPCEVVWTSDDGQTVLIHLPALTAEKGGTPSWKPSLAHASRSVRVGIDGSTHEDSGLGATARYSLGPVAPLAGPPTIRRRRARYRSLCQWDHEQSGNFTHAPTPSGCLDVDPTHGLFAIAASEPARPYPKAPVGLSSPAPVTVDYLDGYSDHIGARADAREPILNTRLPEPTRIVSGSGRLHQGAPAKWHSKPRYRSLTDALSAIASGADGKVAPHEIIQIEDSATYIEAPAWPSGPAQLTIQAAESERPVLRLTAPWAAGNVGYEALSISGVALGGEGKSGVSIELPATKNAALHFCTVTRAIDSLAFKAPKNGAIQVLIERSVTGALKLAGAGSLKVLDSVIDAAGGRAIEVEQGMCELARVTVLAVEEDLTDEPPTGVIVGVLEATEVIFQSRVQVLDRFHGCIRYSRVAPGSVLPRRHRVVETEARLLSRDRHDPAHARLPADAPRELLRGAEDGSELGAFHDVRLAQRYEAVIRRLGDFTPAGVLTGVVRLD
jgi:hypothetical protein